MSIARRISEIIEKEGISMREFERSIMASDGLIRRAINNNTDIQAKWLANIADKYPHISIEWLLTGKGEILKKNYKLSEHISTVNEPSQEYITLNKDIYIKQIISENNKLKEEVEALKKDKQDLKNDIALKNELIEAFRTGKITFTTISPSPNKEKGAR